MLNQVLPQTQSLIVEEKLKKKQKNGHEGLHVMPYTLKGVGEGSLIKFCWEFVGLVAGFVGFCLVF